MSDGERLDTLEERLMRLQVEIEELDDALRDHIAARYDLARRVARLEARLEGDDGEESAGDGGGR